jgi:predicted SAM-dependent methyltransferase
MGTKLCHFLKLFYENLRYDKSLILKYHKYWKTLKKIDLIFKSEPRINIKLDLGCGSLNRPGFYGIDINPIADLQWDIRNGLPFPNNSVSEIRSDHFFEHLDMIEVIKVFQECYRILLKGGILDFTVPHFDPFLEAYIKGDLEFLIDKIYDIPTGQEEIYSTCFDRISWLLLRSGEHRTIFDKKSLLAKLNLAGFNNINVREFDANVDISKRFSSIYITVTK